MKENPPNVYLKATEFFPWNMEKSIFNIIVKSIWTKQNLYYFRSNRDDYYFMRVNLQTGKQDHLFSFSELSKKLKMFKYHFEENSELLTNLSIKEENTTNLEFCYKRNQWVFVIENKELKKTGEAKNYLLSPDKKWGLETENNNLFLIKTEEKESHQITNDGEEYYNYATSPETNTCTVSNRIANKSCLPVAAWSPNSKKLVTHKLDQRHVTDLYLLQNVPKDSFRPKLHKYKMSFSGDKIQPLAELQIIDIESKAIIPVKTDALLSPYLTAIEFEWVWWGRDSESIYFLRETRGSKEIILSSIDSQSGHVEELICEKAEFSYVEPSAIAPWKPQVIILKNRFEIIWLSERDGYAHLYLFDLKQKKFKSQITEGEWCVREVHFYDEEDDWLYFSASGYYKKTDPYFNQFFRCRLNGQELQCLSQEEGCHTINISPDKSHYLDTYSMINSPPISCLKKMNGEIISIVETADISQLRQLNWTPPIRFCVKGRDGHTDIYGNMYFPSNFDENKKYPIIDHIYPGPQIFRTPTQFDLYKSRSQSIWFAQVLAELGFIVLHIDGFGTPGRSKEFHDYTYQNMGDCGLPDHVSAIEQLAKQYSFINYDKIGITGYSGGGYAAARAILLYPDIFKVAVSLAGNHELRAYPANYGEKYNSLDLTTYQSQSNSMYAQNLKGKLLLIHGELDDNVHPCATLQLVNALIENNKDFDLVYLPNQNHKTTFSHPYSIRKTWDYLVEHLLEKKPPINFTFPKKLLDNPALVEW